MGAVIEDIALACMSANGPDACHDADPVVRWWHKSGPHELWSSGLVPDCIMGQSRSVAFDGAFPQHAIPCVQLQCFKFLLRLFGHVDAVLVWKDLFWVDRMSINSGLILGEFLKSTGPA